MTCSQGWKASIGFFQSTTCQGHPTYLSHQHLATTYLGGELPIGPSQAMNHVQWFRRNAMFGFASGEWEENARSSNCTRAGCGTNHDGIIPLNNMATTKLHMKMLLHQDLHCRRASTGIPKTDLDI